MKLALFADLHPLGERLSEFRRQWEACLDRASEMGCSALLIAGDVYDLSNVADGHASTGAVYDAVVDPLAKWLDGDAGRFLLAIPGNHDKASDADVDALKTLGPLPSAIVRREVAWVRLSACDGESVGILNAPWFYAGDAESAVRAALADRPAGCSCYILMAHAQVHGGRMSGEQTCEHVSWGFSREFLDEMSKCFDLVHLGDFHGEQEYAPGVWHNGALWQQNVGEAGNRQGFAIFDTVTKVRTAVEVNESRRHRKEFARTPEQADALGQTFDPQTERLWIVTDGFELPRAAKVALQERGIFVKPKDLPKAERVSRPVELDTTGAGLDDFAVLRAFVSSREGAIGEGEATALGVLLGDVLASNPKLASVTASTVGCMSPVRTMVRGVGRHVAETVIDWTRMGPLCAVFGDNGAGKTTAIGALPLAAWDAIPGYDGGIGQNLTCGGDGCAEASGEFVSRGRRFRAERLQTASSHKAWLREFVGDAWEDIAGPKVTDVRAKVETLFGTIEAARSTWFVSADRDDDLCASDATPGRRREMFGQYLDFARMNKVAEACGEAAKDTEAELRTLTEQLKGLPDYEARLAEARAELTEAETVAVARQRERDEAREAVEAAEKELRAASGDDSALRQAITLHEASVAAVNAAQARVNELTTEVEILRGRVAGLDQAKADKATLEQVRERLTALDRQASAHRTFDAWKREDDRLRAERDRADSAVKLARAESGVSAEDKALAATAEKLKQDGLAARAKRETAERSNAELAKERRRLDDAVKALDRDLSAWKARLDGKKPTPFGDDCVAKGCHFLAELAALPGKIEAATAERTWLVDSLAALPADAALEDLQPMRDAYARAHAAEERVSKAGAATARIEATEAALATAESALSAHGEVQPEAVEDPSIALRTARADADRLAGAPAKVEALERDAETMHRKSDALAEAQTKLANEQAAELERRDPADRARAALKDRESALANLRQRVDMAKGSLGSAENAVTANAGLQGSLKERIAGLETNLADVATRRATCNAVEVKAKCLRTLQVAFGPKGVQPILIDAAAPELEDIANRLLSDATDGDHTLRIVTQERTDKGEIRETFLVLVTDDRGERDIGKFSGGEREKVQIVFRAALSLWLARRLGSPLESLIIDEAFNKLTPKNHRAMVRVLEGLARHFDRIVVITPNPGLCSLFPSQVWIHATYNGCRVEYRGERDSMHQADGVGEFDHVGADGTVTPDFVGAVK